MKYDIFISIKYYFESFLDRQSHTVEFKMYKKKIKINTNTN